MSGYKAFGPCLIDISYPRTFLPSTIYVGAESPYMRDELPFQPAFYGTGAGDHILCRITRS